MHHLFWIFQCFARKLGEDKSNQGVLLHGLAIMIYENGVKNELRVLNAADLFPHLRSEIICTVQQQVSLYSSTYSYTTISIKQQFQKSSSKKDLYQ